MPATPALIKCAGLPDQLQEYQGFGRWQSVSAFGENNGRAYLWRDHGFRPLEAGTKRINGGKLRGLRVSWAGAATPKKTFRILGIVITYLSMGATYSLLMTTIA